MKTKWRNKVFPVTETTPLVVSATIPVRDISRERNQEWSSDVNESILDDVLDTLKLGIPIAISYLSWVGKKTTDSAILGHVSREALAAASLSDLWTMTTQVLLSGRVLRVLVGGAIGSGNPKLGGIYLQVSYAVLSAVSIFVFAAWNMTESVWLWFGSDPEICRMAGYYARVLSFAIPAMIGFTQLAQYFFAQKIMHPLIHSSGMGLIANLVLGLVFVLGWPLPKFDGFGFEACPIVTTCVTYFQLAFLIIIYIYFGELHLNCWPGWRFNEITWSRIKTFSDLYFPQALSSTSDLWRVAVIGGVAAKMGDMEVAVYNTAYRIAWFTMMFVFAMAGASSTNMCLRLGRGDSKSARQAGYVGVSLATAILITESVLLLTKGRWFGLVFSNDKEFLLLFDEALVPFTATLFFMNLCVALEQIPYSMGRTREVFWLGFFASWGGQVPAVLLLTRYWRNDLVGLYTGMALGYFMLTILYAHIVCKSDWEKYVEMTQKRSEARISMEESQRISMDDDVERITC
ncbi:multidrug efflux protein [Nitzschia inconspicua]|uniref:Multidrug efflux protein n=1 Tax=Nitzschia inconspicua TaxID=303405 RepID=A0A9K3LP63_9STRA|nr:multidrug efflux protein [Nitzschia inconspicua]